MKVSFSKDGKTLIIEAPIASEPSPSASGKTLVLASTRGNLKTGLKIGDKEIVLGLNAYVAK